MCRLMFHTEMNHGRDDILKSLFCGLLSHRLFFVCRRTKPAVNGVSHLCQAQMSVVINLYYRLTGCSFPQCWLIFARCVMHEAVTSDKSGAVAHFSDADRVLSKKTVWICSTVTYYISWLASLCNVYSLNLMSCWRKKKSSFWGKSVTNSQKKPSLNVRFNAGSPWLLLQVMLQMFCSLWRQKRLKYPWNVFQSVLMPDGTSQGQRSIKRL